MRILKAFQQKAVFVKFVATKIMPLEWRTGVFTIIGLTGLVMNAFVVLVMRWKKSKAKHVANKFLINQCIVDATASVVLLFSWDNLGPFLNVVLDESSLKSWAFCKLYISNFFLWPVLMSSTANLIIVTVDRYLKVVHPVFHKMSVTKKIENILLVCVWLFGFLFAGSILFSYAKVKGNVCLLNAFPSVRIAQIAGTIVFTVQFIIPIVTFFFCYIGMLRVLRKKNKTTASVQNSAMTTSSESQEATKKRIQKNIIITLAVVAAAFVVCWVWNSVLFILVTYGVFSAAAFQSTFYHFSICMIYLNCCSNPFIYIIFMKGFKDDILSFIKHYLHCRCSRNAVGPTG